jgi:prepilin-type N-terminal cleavage/methylation domain-containing protein
MQIEQMYHCREQLVLEDSVLQALESAGLPKRTNRGQVEFVRNTSPYRQEAKRGFSMLELVIAITVGLILTGMAIPKVTTLVRSYRSVGDARSLSEEISLSKMRGPANFTEARVYADLSTNRYRVETWTLPTGGSSKCWVTDGDTHCSSSYASPNTPPSTLLLTTVTFGYGSLGSAPTGTQTTLGQAPACQTDSETAAGNVGDVANSACIVFNSRGIPIDNTGAPTTNDALYVTDGISVYGVTVLATGLIQTWRSGLPSANWSSR